MFSAATFRFSQLSIGVSRTSIRHGHTRPRRRVPQLELAKFPKGHGEKIWVHYHLTSNQVVYSHTEALDSNRALRQLPFNGKKSKPAGLRRDYWRPLAMIQLPAGAGAAGQSVFQKLREFRRMHELCWGDEVLKNVKDPETTLKGQMFRRIRSRQDRSIALNDQRANAIADMAAVLAGHGRGCRLLVTAKEKGQLSSGMALRGRKWSKFAPTSKTGVGFDVKPSKRKGSNPAKLTEIKSADGTDAAKDSSNPVVANEILPADEPGVEAKPAEPVVDIGEQLLPVTIYWAIDNDRSYARKWSANVQHKLMDNAILMRSAMPSPKAKKPKVEKVEKSEPVSIQYVQKIVKETPVKA